MVRQFRQSDINKAARLFFRNEVRDLEAATASANRAAAEALARETRKELRTNFKRSRGSNFAKAVKVRNLPSKGALSPASFVRLGIPFLSIFQTGGTIRPVKGKYLITLLTTGAKLGFKRINKNNPWSRVWSRIRERSFFVKKSDGILIFYRNPNGRVVPIYKMVESVEMPKKLNFYENAEKFADEIPDIVQRLLDNELV